MCLNSSAFILRSRPLRARSLTSPSGLPFNETRLDRQLGRPETQRLACGPLRHTVELEHDAARLDAGHPELGCTLARTHAHLRRLFCHGHVRKDADPDAAGALHGTRDRPSRRLDLARRQPFRLDGLEAIGAEIQGRSTLGVAMDATLVGLAVLGAD